MALLEVDNLNVRFATPDGEVHAVKDLSFALEQGETLGIVGESGSGKSQTVMSIVGLLAANGRATGVARFAGRDLLALPPKELRTIRGRKIAMIFQDPMTSLNPYLTIEKQMVAAIRALEASKARLFALNQVIAGGRVIGLFAGHPLDALAQALPLVRATFGHRVAAPFDCVVACVAPPLDRDLYQADKGIKNTEVGVRDGGVLVLDAACSRGVGIDHFVGLLRSAPTFTDVSASIALTSRTAVNGGMTNRWIRRSRAPSAARSPSANSRASASVLFIFQLVPIQNCGAVVIIKSLVEAAAPPGLFLIPFREGRGPCARP